jgi:hypothetical protein
MARAKRHKPLRRGYDVESEVFKAMEFTVGLPPNLYVPQTKQITDISQRLEHKEANFHFIDSTFSIHEGHSILDPGHLKDAS